MRELEQLEYRTPSGLRLASMVRITLLVGLAACTFPSKSQEFACSVDSDCDGFPGRTCEQGFCVVGDDDTTVDGGDDGVDMPPAFDCKDFKSRLFADACGLEDPTGPLEVTGAVTYNTDTGVLSSGAVVSSVVDGRRVISVDKLVIAAGSKLRVTGALPLVIASRTTAEIAGTIDVGSTGTELGAGANGPACATHLATKGGDDDVGAGGGGGAALAAAGGVGGRGQGANGGAAGTLFAAPLLGGGCAGAIGGTGREGGGAGGAGGGAVAVIAFDSLTVSGVITAGGAGGRGAAGENGGGGGGGSGGMIVLEGATVSVTGTLAANGGGGGSGSKDVGGRQGNPGQDGQATATPATGGVGGAGGTAGGASGGAGGAGATLAGSIGGNSNDDAGGGGGGSVGAIVVASTSAASLGGIISPAATTAPRP